MPVQQSLLQAQSKNASKPHPKYRNIIFDIGRVLLEWRPEHIVSQVFKDQLRSHLILCPLFFSLSNWYKT